MSRLVPSLVLAASLSQSDAFVLPSTGAAALRPVAPLALAPVATPSRAGAVEARLGGGGYGGGPYGGGPLGGGGGFDPSSLIGPVILVSLIASGALGWIFNGILFLSLIPLIAGPLVSWYFQQNLLEGACPECGAPVQVLKGQRGSCMYCSASMSSELQNGVFTRDGAAARDDGVVEVDVLVDDDNDFGGPRRYG